MRRARGVGRKTRLGRVAGPFAIGLAGLALASPAAAVPGLDLANDWITNGPVNDAAIAADGTAYLTGNFTWVGPRTGAATRVDAAGAPVEGLPQVQGTVNAIEPDGSGGYYIGGNFFRVDGVARNRLAHIDSTGALTSWAPDPDRAVHDLELVGGSLYVAGEFTQIDGQARANLAEIETTGHTVTAWDPGINSFVRDIEIDGTTLYAGGQFTTVNGATTRNRLAAFDRTTAVATAWDPNMNGTVLDIEIAGSDVYVGGQFTTVNGVTPRLRLAKFTTASATADAWDPGANQTVEDLAVDGTDVYVAGGFSSAGGQSRSGLAEIDATGAATSWAPNPPFAQLYEVEIRSGTLYVGGTFSSIAGEERGRLASFDTATGALNAWNPNSGGSVNEFAFPETGTDVYVGGGMRGIGGVTRHDLAAIDPDTGRATAWNPSGVGNSASNDGDAITISGNDVFVCGSWTELDGQTVIRRLAKIDATTGALDTSWNPNPNNTCRDLEVDGSRLWVAGAHSGTIGGQSRNGLAAIDRTTGLADASFPNYRPTGTIHDIEIANGILYMGGSFTAFWPLGDPASTPRNRLAAIDLGTGALTSWDPDVSSQVNAIAVEGNAVYASGNFSTIGGTSRSRLAAIDATTGLVTPWAPNTTTAPNALQVKDGVVYAAPARIGGAFSSGAGIDAADDTNVVWSGPGGGDVRWIEVDGTTALVGGQGLSINDLPIQGFARFGGAPVSTAPPRVSGTPRDGETLGFVAGTWQASPDTVYTSAWSMCGPTGSGCAPISGASGATLTAGPADVGETVRIGRSGTNRFGTTDTESALVGPIAPRSTAAPSVSGSATIGGTLTTTDGEWNGVAGLDISYQWQRCDGGACTDISSATSATYSPVAADAGFTLKAVVSASKNGSAPTKAVSATTSAVPALPDSTPDPAPNPTPGGGGSAGTSGGTSSSGVPARLLGLSMSRSSASLKRIAEASGVDVDLALTRPFRSGLVVRGLSSEPGTKIVLWGPRGKIRTGVQVASSAGQRAQAVTNADDKGRFVLRAKTRMPGRYWISVEGEQPDSGIPMWVRVVPQLQGRLEGDTLKAWVRPPVVAPKGTKVALQRRMPGTRNWRTVAVGRPDAKGRMQMNVTERVQRLGTLRILIPADKRGLRAQATARVKVIDD